MNRADPILEARAVRFGFGDKPEFLGPLDIAIRPGEFWGIIGPNGAGKTTLLRLLAGILRPRGGDVRLAGRSLGHTSWRERARRLAYLPQKVMGDPDATALETVLMGRYPHRGFGLFESAEDVRVARRTMETTETTAFAERAMGTLSGGESQRVHLAAALAQEPSVLLLDEPASALDLTHQLSVFALLAGLACDSGAAIAVVTHDLNLAAHHCDHLALMADGKIAAHGPTDSVCRAATLAAVYGVAFDVCRSNPDGPSWLLPRRIEATSQRSRA